MVVLEWMLNQTEGDNMPLTTKGKTVFYASKNKGKIKGVDKTRK